uniref:Ig-like domain-containing protein n=1 Tax=Laticauda laticaudata TaxID=8630 RepID=A0A8C5RY95_LATLA
MAAKLTYCFKTDNATNGLPKLMELQRMAKLTLAFTIEPSDQIAVQEQPLVLDCQVEGIQPISITWRKNGMLVAEGMDPMTLANGSLYFSHFQKQKEDGTSDEGEYGCVARNHFGLLVSRKARIQAASKWSFLPNPRDISMAMILSHPGQDMVVPKVFFHEATELSCFLF